MSNYDTNVSNYKHVSTVHHVTYIRIDIVNELW